MKNILYTIILSFLFFSSVCLADWFADWEDADHAYAAGDYATALKGWKALAEQGYDFGQVSLGYMYEEGKGVIQDYNAAVKWYRRAAENGNSKGQLHLGYMYANGKGVIQDFVIAHMWYNIAARDGGVFAMGGREFVESKMSSEQLAEAQKLARECIKKNYKDCG